MKYSGHRKLLWILKIIKIKCFYSPRILDEHWCICSCLQIPPRENWFQYVRRVYATAINIPCIITLDKTSEFIRLYIIRNSKHFGSSQYSSLFKEVMIKNKKDLNLSCNTSQLTFPGLDSLGLVCRKARSSSWARRIWSPVKPYLFTAFTSAWTILFKTTRDCIISSEPTTYNSFVWLKTNAIFMIYLIKNMKFLKLGFFINFAAKLGKLYSFQLENDNIFHNIHHS